MVISLIARTAAICLVSEDLLDPGCPKDRREKDEAWLAENQIRHGTDESGTSPSFEERPEGTKFLSQLAAERGYGSSWDADTHLRIIRKSQSEGISS